MRICAVISMLLIVTLRYIYSKLYTLLQCPEGLTLPPNIVKRTTILGMYSIYTD
jgi:hypothetical protein